MSSNPTRAGMDPAQVGRAVVSAAISRRAALKGVGAGALALGLWSAGRPARAQSAGTLTVVDAAIGNPTYIPSRLNQDSMRIALATFGESLLQRHNDQSLGPQLAESWSVSEDGLTLTFNIRRGVPFHDGSELTAADVRYTFEQIGTADSTNADAALWRNALESVETPDDYTVVLHLKKRDIGLPIRLASPFYGTQVILSKANIERLGDDAAALAPIGTGPWKFAEFRAGELVRCTAVENHWRQTPAFQELIIRQVPEESTRVAMVQSGQADLAQIAVSSGQQLEASGGKLFVDQHTHVLLVCLLGQYRPDRAGFNPDVPWAADPADPEAWERARKVREAMSIAIDRETIVETVLAGRGDPAIYQYAAPESAFFDPTWAPIPYDPERAQQLLAEAGYPDGFEFPLLLVEATGRPGAPEVGEAVAQYWQLIGLRPQLQRSDYTATVRPAIGNRDLAGSAFTWSNSSVAEPVIGHQGGFWTNADVMFGAEYPPLDALIEQALATPDFEQRREIERQIGKMVIDQYFTMTIAWANGIWGGSARIADFPRLPGITGPYNFEYVIPA